MSSHFKNIEINDDSQLIMDIYGLDTSIINSFRRIVLSDVLCNAFDKIDIEKNTSIINNEILSHRLGLIPLTIDDLDDVCVELDVKNTGYEKINITSSDLKVIQGELKIIPDILLVELKRGEEIKAKLYTSKKSGKIHAKYQPVSVCCFKIQEDVSINIDIWNKLTTRQKNKLRKLCIQDLPLSNTHYLEKNSIGTYGFKEHFKNTPEKIKNYIESYLIKCKISEEDVKDKSVIYQPQYCNKHLVYKFKMEPHLVNPYKIFSAILEELCNKIINLQNKDIEIIETDNNVGLCFEIKNEGHTIGNLLSTELQQDNRVKYSYYKVKHPFIRNIMLYIILEKEDEKEDIYAKILADAFKRVLSLCTNLKKEWAQILKDVMEIIEI
jgi:DNA-directed RNA polymerase subunit L